jgi:hypothetical protein
MANNVEGAAASNVSNSVPTANLGQIGLMGLVNKWMNPDKGGSQGQQFKGPRTAASYHNENTMKNLDLGRYQEATIHDFQLNEGAKNAQHLRSENVADNAHLRAKDMVGHLASAAGDGAQLTHVKAYGHEARFEHPKPPTRNNGTTTSKGKPAEFKDPMPVASLPGAGGKRVANPDYQAWAGKRNAVNAERTAGNTAPIARPSKPGKAPVVPKA